MTVIPPMTHPLSQHWRQPSVDLILVDEMHAVMSLATLKALPEYSWTIPTGVYEGKMWRCHAAEGDCYEWLLRWYDADPADAKCCLIFTRGVLLLNEQEEAA